MTARKRVSKKLKKSWRKNCDASDVENYLESKRLDERLGTSFEKTSDDALFTIDTSPSVGHEAGVMLSSAQRKKKARKAPNCYKALVNTSAVPDPISKRNRVRTKEERRDRIAKSKDLQRERLGIFKKKEILGLQDRKLSIIDGKRKKRNEGSRMKLAKEVWSDTGNPIENNKEIDPQWISQEAKDHFLKNTPYRRKNVPLSIKKRPNLIPSVAIPHPGMSYNPSLEDHQNLLKLVAKKEEDDRKKDEHLDRVTSKMFQRMTREEVEKQWWQEMCQGLEDKINLDHIKLQPGEVKDEPPVSNEYSTVNAPVDRDRQRSLQSRRRQREEMKRQKEIKAAKIEKKKLTDIYKLRQISKEVDQFEKQIEKTEEKRQLKKEQAPYETRRVGRNKYEEPDLDFSLYHDLTGSLRTVQPEGKPLTDRFRSFAKRNILEPTVKQTKRTFTKTKTFIKTDHRIPELAKINDLQKKEKKRRRTLRIKRNNKKNTNKATSTATN